MVLPLDTQAPTVRATTRVRVRYAETDKMGFVYYANYFVWFEVGRGDLLRSLGWSYRDIEAEGTALPVIEAWCKYTQPARYDDELDILVEGTLLSPVRLQFDYRVTRVPGGDPIVTGRTEHAAINAQGRPCRLPERVRKAFS